MAIYRTASFLVRSESIEKCKEHIRTFIADIKATEPGTTLYVSLQDQVNPNRFFHFYVFADEAAERRHADAQISKRFSEFLIPELAGPVSFGDYDLVADT